MTVEDPIGWEVALLFFLAVTFTGLALINAFQAFRLRQYYGSPRFADIFRWANEDPKQIKLVFLDTLLAAVNANDERLANKQFYANRASWLVLFSFLSFLFAIIAIGIRLFVTR